MPRVIDIINSPWAITPSWLVEIQKIYIARINREKLDFSAVEAQIGRPLKNKNPQTFEVVDNIAILEIEGVIGKKMNLFTDISGGVSTQKIEAQFDEAIADENIKGVILNIDSPGGSVEGTFELAEKIYNGRGIKPIIAYTDGMMTSAAYWIGSAADKIFISGANGNPNPSLQVGSIGVLTRHVDISKSEEKQGIKTTEIVAGNYKNSRTQHKPLSESGQNEMQTAVDHIYNHFVEAVARNRDVKIQTVLKKMADGKIFLGEEAIAAGLVDGASTLTEVIDMAGGGTAVDSGDLSQITLPAINAASKEQTTEEDETVSYTLEQVKKEHPEWFESVRAEGLKLGAEREMVRIHEVEAQAVPGHESLINTLKFDGKTTGAEAAVLVIQAEKSRLAGVVKTIEESSIKPVVDVPEEKKVISKKTYEVLVEEYMTENNCKRREAIRAISEDYPEEYDNYINIANRKG